MFNSPVLDVAIGLVFIFLLYSLLATSVKEAIATLFGLRANMLKKGIVTGMLSNTSNDFKIVSIIKGVFKTIVKIFYSLGIVPKKTSNKLGDNFYSHPLIKNYGASRIFPLPSYISTENFSTVLIDVLKEDFDKKIDDITAAKINSTRSTDSPAAVKKNLQYSNDANKIKELLDYYSIKYDSNNTDVVKKNTPKYLEDLSQKFKALKNSLTPATNTPNNSADGKPLVIDKDTVDILQMHLRNSVYDIEAFTKKIEDWFDDSMNRVSGWYKRQVQTILFILGLIMAITFNVDILQIANKLTTDKDARDKIVQLAIKASDQYKDDPRVKKIITAKGDTLADYSSDSTIFKEYQNKIADVKKELDSNVANTNNLLAIGWGDYGKSRDSIDVIGKYSAEFYKIVNDSLLKKSKPLSITDTINVRTYALSQLYNEDHWIKLKVFYVLRESFKGKKFLGFLILAFAVCLGAPFWFDLLNKLIQLRGTGKKEDGDANSAPKKTKNQQPVNVIVNNQKTGEEAVG